ncbi:hypothetical protein AM501_13485 [Aneurinibacillus migulanus]|jgi:predicted Ser/Thr protein kinase|uniref:Protein kinase domain-containing protein n=1 Tax=Aneurinibacillus migulanus TaxID=47500 RepID=A0A0D1Y8K1_ANEMI|nr:hypothetical protein [Aneurinibacillus migulanus]KIV53009.1 hypothetical protein TS64_21025 [Aneurinibacillus migulanus]KIV55457.1 hypothetical protein TS65_15930 [Aneurinibacillus migulanus]KON90758.1 hypothetical protein AF333_27325 [Aneurinibacillus migulanus]KPD07769.1 hypothetical protein AM501_13485 [Aneurinibacillus migulanus]MCP1357949.1 hypothetical protein [Aneurinibacillus migulanus]
MNDQEIAQQLKKIKVINQEQADVEVENPTSLTMIGKGRQGAVFQIDENTCAKVYGNPEDCEREHYALSLGQETGLFPRIYSKGQNYIVMEMVRGIDLREYLQSQPLTKELSLKLIEMLVTFQQIGFDRIDHHKRQIYLQQDGTLKVIDVGRTVWRDRTYPYPRKLLTSLGDEYKELFLSHVREMNPKLYAEWQHYMEMEESARHMFKTLFSKRLEDAEGIAIELSESLLTVDDQKKHYAKLEGLVRKVFKEEWIKVLVLQGRDPEKVKGKIDAFLEKQERKEWGEMGKKKRKLPDYVKELQKQSQQQWASKQSQQEASKQKPLIEDVMKNVHRLLNEGKKKKQKKSKS